MVLDYSFAPPPPLPALINNLQCHLHPHTVDLRSHFTLYAVALIDLDLLDCSLMNL